MNKNFNGQSNIVKTNPNAYKSKSQVLEEIEMHEKKIENISNN